MTHGYGSTPDGQDPRDPPPPPPPPPQPAWVPTPAPFRSPAPSPPSSRRSWALLLGAVVVVMALAAVGFVAVAGRGGSDGEAASGEGSGPSATAGPRPGRTITDRSDEEVISDAVAEIEEFWSSTFANVYGQSYEPVSGGFHPYGPRTDLPPCPGITSYADIAGNAFYCPEADLVAWDETTLVPTLRREFGELTLGIVMAHEIAHAVQSRVGTQGRTVTLELQADCFAGAWVRSAADGRSQAFSVGPGELDQALAGMLNLRDAPGVSGADPSAHGSAFDRVSALQDGFDNGAEPCARYRDESVSNRLVAREFTDVEDFERGGNAPFEDIADLAIADLEDFWSTVFARSGREWTPVASTIAFDPDDDVPACGDERSDRADYVGAAFYCEAEDYVAWDDAYLMPTLYEQGGDFAVATVIGEQYAVAVQSRLDVQGEPLGLALQSDCLTGAWAADAFNGTRGPDAPLVMSPGDLDEAILAMLALGDPPEVLEEGRAERGSGFQRVSAFREGFLGASLGACDAFLT